MINFPQRNWTDYGGEVTRYAKTPRVLDAIKLPINLFGEIMDLSLRGLEAGL